MVNNISPDNNIPPITGEIEYNGEMNQDVKKQIIYNIGKTKTEKTTHHKPRIIKPENYDNLEELFQDINIWWTKRYRKKPESWNHYQGLLKDMAEHPIFPINIYNPNPDQVIAQLDYLEEENIKQNNDNTGIYTVINRWKSIKALMRSYGRIKETANWNYTPPPAPTPRPRIIPSINIVYNLTHHKYSKNRYENKLYQYIALLSYMIGFRPASEMTILKTTDMDFESGILTFYQPKTEKYRSIALPKKLLKSKNTKCIHKWINSWRPQVTNQYSKDYMFIQPNGKPFTEAYFTKKLREKYIPVWNEYYPYNSRHWYATGRLIQTKLEHGVYGMKEVCDDMDHSGVSVTEEYTKTVNKWYKIAPFDWFKTLLKFPKKLEQQKGLKNHEKPVPRKKGGVLVKIPSVGGYEPMGVDTCLLLLKKPVQTLKTHVLGFQYYLTNLFSFIYNKLISHIFSDLLEPHKDKNGESLTSKRYNLFLSASHPNTRFTFFVPEELMTLQTLSELGVAS